MNHPSSLRSARLVARLARLTVSVALLFVGGCPLIVTDHNAFQTGKVLHTGEVGLCATTFNLYPMRASVDVGLGRRWEAGAGFGRTVSSWGWSGDLSVTRSLYSSRYLYSSVLLQAELARGEGLLKPLGRVTTAAALSYWPSERFGFYMPLRLSMLFTSPVTFPYMRRVWTDSGTVYVPGERVFHGLHDPVLTTGLGLAYEYKRFFSRLAVTYPVTGPEVVEDSVSTGFFLFPYAGFQVGVRLF